MAKEGQLSTMVTVPGEKVGKGGKEWDGGKGGPGMVLPNARSRIGNMASSDESHELLSVVTSPKVGGETESRGADKKAAMRICSSHGLLLQFHSRATTYLDWRESPVLARYSRKNHLRWKGTVPGHP